MTQHVEHETIELVRKLRYDLTAMQAKVTDLLTMLTAAGLEPPAKHECGKCGASFRGPFSLAEHTYHSHGGPEPDHWVEAEELAGLEID